jgi:hypothetical protein
MKHLKMLCLVIIALVAAIALAGVGSASATVLCKTTTTPCNSPYGNGTAFVTSLSGSITLEAPEEEGEEPLILSTCGETGIKSRIEGSGGATSTVGALVEAFTFGKCSGPATALEKGSLQIHHISGSDNGTVTGLSFSLTSYLSIIGSCNYGTATATDMGTLVGGESPIIKVNEVVTKRPSSAACPPEMRWTGEFKITEPTPLYVEPS